MTRARLSLTILLVLFAAACSGTEEAVSEGRLVILNGSGDVVVMDRDGSNRLPVSEDAGEEAGYFQPIWDPSGETIAVTRVAPGGEPQLVLRDLDAAAAVQVAVPSVAFYLSWSPNGERIGLLSNWATGLRFDIVDTDGEPVADDVGQPYYFSWEPDGSRLVAHVGTDRLDVRGNADRFALENPGTFRAPQWTEDGIVYVRRGATPQLVRAGADGATDVLAEVSGGAVFSMSSDGRRIAIQPAGGDQGAVSVAAQAVPRLPDERLVVLDVSSGEWQRVGDAPVVGFWWSPDGRSLLVLTVAEEGFPMLAWSVWEDGVATTPTVFEPDPSFVRDLLPFFDQYAQSMSLWAPDGTAFAFPGRIGAETGIWVHPVDGTPELIDGGTWVAWSPR